MWTYDQGARTLSIHKLPNGRFRLTSDENGQETSVGDLESPETEGDGESSSTGPAAFVSEEDVVKEAKAHSLSTLATATEQRIENLGR